MDTGFLVLDIVYAISVVVFGILTALYHTAYIKMHKTRVIQSVCILMLSLFVESVYFLATSISMTFNSDLIKEMLMIPWLWSIPKLFLLFAAMYFLYVTLAPNEQHGKKCRELEKASEISTLKK
jgi:LytS/YehU family sensor histidine kinase